MFNTNQLNPKCCYQYRDKTLKHSLPVMSLLDQTVISVYLEGYMWLLIDI